MKKTGIPLSVLMLLCAFCPPAVSVRKSTTPSVVRDSQAGLQTETEKKFEPSLLQKIHALVSNNTPTDIPLIIRLAKTNDTRMDDLKERAASLLIHDHNSSVYSVCRVLPYVMAKVPVFEAENVAAYDFVTRIDEADTRFYCCLNVSVPTIRADTVRINSGFDGRSITIAIIDSGIHSHPDFWDPVTRHSKIIAEVCFVDRNHDGVPDESPDDIWGHGTYCAGIAAGTGNASQFRFIGVAPGANLMNLKVCYMDYVAGEAYADEDAIVNAIDYAVYYGAHVISISMVSSSSGDGMSPVSQASDDAVEAGVVVVAASGNKGGHAITQPADAFNVIAVGAEDDKNTTSINDDTLWDGSTGGPAAGGRPKPDVVAPGVSIISPMDGNAIMFGWQTGNPWVVGVPGYPNYAIGGGGTSAAAPHVAGTVALMLQANPNLTPAQVKAIVRQTARLNDNLQSLGINDRGYGIIDAYAAVQLAQNTDNIQINQMYDSWNVKAPNDPLAWFSYDYLTFTVDAPSCTFGIPITNVYYHYRGFLGIGDTDYELVSRISVQHVWVNGVYYKLGGDMQKYLFSGPRIYDEAVNGGVVLLRALYRIGDVQIVCNWFMGVEGLIPALEFNGASSWKALIYVDADVWGTPNYAYLPSTSETVLVERKITGSVDIDVRTLDKAEHVRIFPDPLCNPTACILRADYSGNNPDDNTVLNDEYVYNRYIVICYQLTGYAGTSAVICIRRETDTLPAPNPIQDDAGCGNDAGKTFDSATPISPGSYTGILCYSDPIDTQDYYGFNLMSGQYINVSMTPPLGIDFALQLYDPYNNPKAGSDSGGGITDSVFFIADSTGEWRIRINVTLGEAQYSFYLSIKSKVCAMKTEVAGHFYTPRLPTNLLKVEKLFSGSAAENLTGDQRGPASPYGFYPDGHVNLMDYFFVVLQYGTNENSSNWDYMSDINSDKSCNLIDYFQVAIYYGKEGNYSQDLSGVVITFYRGGQESSESPDANGFVTIPQDATSFNVTRYSNTIGAMITFWEP